MRGEYTELPCPFCDKGKIQALYFPGALHEKRSGGKRSIKSINRTSDNWIIKSGCSVCGKDQNLIEKKLREDNII